MLFASAMLAPTFCAAVVWRTGVARVSDVSLNPRWRARGGRAHAPVDHAPVEGEFR
jgi:hypothetical protein